MSWSVSRKTLLSARPPEARRELPPRVQGEWQVRMRNEGTEFRHLYDVCSRALSLGNPQPVAILLRAYRDEARMLENKDHRKLDFGTARGKARRLADLLAEHRGDAPQPGHDAESPHAAVHRRRQRDPLANMVLSPGQIRAAVEIRDVFEATIRGLTARVLPNRPAPRRRWQGAERAFRRHAR